MTDSKELTFEEAMKELEEIVEKLEAGDVPLEEAIAYYQKGIEYSKICNDKLQTVEKKMTTILNEQGELEALEIQEDN